MTSVPQSQPLAAGQAASITEADIMEYLRSQANRLSAQTSTDYASVQISVIRTSQGVFEHAASAYIDGGDHLKADTVADAVNRQVVEFVPIKAKNLREKAAALIAEANDLEVRALNSLAQS